MKANSQMKPFGRRGLQFVTSFAVTFLILSVGFLIVWLSFTRESVKTNVEEGGWTATVSPDRESELPTFEGLIDSQKLASLTGKKNSFERSLELDDILAEADTNLLRELYVESRSISSLNIRESVQAEILRRIASIDPVQALGLLEQEPRLGQELVVEAVFQESAGNDLDSAIEHASTLYPFFLRETALGAMLEVREDLPDSERERIGRHLEQSDFVIQDLINKHDIAALEGHDEIWNKTLNSNRPFNLKYSALTRLAWRRIDQEGLNAIEFLGESLTDWRIRRGVLRESIRWAARWDPKSTFEFALNSFRETDLHLVNEALEHWIEREPENAVNAISQLEPNRFQKELYRNAISFWHSTHPGRSSTILSYSPPTSTPRPNLKPIKKFVTFQRKKSLSWQRKFLTAATTSICLQYCKTGRTMRLKMH